MGGISTSCLRDVPTESYAIWSGICRTDGGGFCGLRTLPFDTTDGSLSRDVIDGTDGVYVVCRLVSDDEPHRRVWKFTLRSEKGRGEKVYQAEYDLGKAMDDAAEDVRRRRGGERNEGAEDDDDDIDDDASVPFATVVIPYDDFRLVRGPRLVPDGPKLNVATNGIYQLGMTLSKFKIGMNTTTIENFRDGYFELQLRSMGLYVDDERRRRRACDDDGVDDATSIVVGDDDANGVVASRTSPPIANAAGDAVVVPGTLSREESMRRRPLLLKIALTAIRLLFSERANRRRSAMKILRTRRGLTRYGAILFGMRYRRRAGSGLFGLLSSMSVTARILGADALRTALTAAFRVGLVYPSRLIGAIVNATRRIAGMKVEPRLRE